MLLIISQSKSWHLSVFYPKHEDIWFITILNRKAADSQTANAGTKYFWVYFYFFCNRNNQLWKSWQFIYQLIHWLTVKALHPLTEHFHFLLVSLRTSLSCSVKGLTSLKPSADEGHAIWSKVPEKATKCNLWQRCFLNCWTLNKLETSDLSCCFFKALIHKKIAEVHFYFINLLESW